MRFVTPPLLATLALLAFTATPASAGHGNKLLDHPAPLIPSPTVPNPGFQSAPSGAWELLGSIPTGNPHSDLDFFTRGGDTYASVGTLATGPNRGGQTIVKLTEGDEVDPELVGAAPTASCFSSPIETLGLQHDVEATPKGKAPLNAFNPYADASDTQLVIDASDGIGRCHDQGTLGLDDFFLGELTAPPGGLEILDVSDPANPVTIGLTSHIGMAHTVNVDPKRPHIAYAVTSDLVSVDEGRRTNEDSGLGLDGFEVVDLSSCMNFPAGTSVEAKRTACAPKVYRYRYPTADMGLGHSVDSFVFGCHELEVYPNDRLTCAGGTALLSFDMTGAFDDRGTPDDYSDDVPRGTPLPCRRRASSSAGPFFTDASVVDCVKGGADGTQLLSVSEWLKIGAPSLTGVRYVGSVHHVGGSDQADVALQPPSEDIIFDHEAELSASGNLLIASDERGGGATPPGATCGGGGGAQVNPQGNGGLHFYRADQLDTTRPTTPEEAWQPYARTPEGGKAIYQAPIRTGAQAIICTAHVFQQIPGQNRIFMGWYSQGTQVLDFTENPDGTVSIEEVGSFIPAAGNQWVSHVFKAQENPDGTFTYWGAAGDFRIGDGGRNTVDVWKVTLPPPPKPADGPGLLPARVQKGELVRDPQTGEDVVASTAAGAPSCVVSRSFRSVSVRRSGRTLAFAFSAEAPVTVDLFRQALRRRVTGERLVRRFQNVSGQITWDGRDSQGRRLPDGHYLVRFASRAPNGQPDERRFALVRRNGRFTVLKGRPERQDQCGLLRRWKLLRPVFGGTGARPLVMSFRFGSDTRASIVVRRGSRVIKRFAEQGFRGGVLHRKRINVKLARRLARGRYRITITVRDGDRTISSSLAATRV